MAASPQPVSENPIDFRAPPPSPIASGRRSLVTNDEVLTEYLEHSLQVPDLILPDKFFPKQNSLENPPTIDLLALNLDEFDASLCKVVESIARNGCFQLVNHGISSELVSSVQAAATGIFQVPPEKRAEITRLPEKPYGFEEVHGEEAGSELSEEFVWCRDQGLKLTMERIAPIGYSNFSEKLETLMANIEKVSRKILPSLWKNSQTKFVYGNDDMVQGKELGTVCCLYKHSQNVLEDEWDSSLRYDVIKMLIRGTDYSHALCLHLCDGSSEFHVYSKKGWVSFTPDKNALVVTTGDQIQAWSGGQYKHVIGRPIFKGEEDCISMAFLYSPPTFISNSQSNKEKTISLGEQAIMAIFLTLVYQFLVYFYRNF
ncbi:PREDICTED: 1-aminocyclopropane-1-carboxylate oxidase 3 [Prunus mume]|uniref:1-aminocyclopropane-1-carboxylate oxidase 3 n=1 Tax=Prunus mume TaxID=102107 RepID=A0ABM0NQT1_PRUMU|nr:PREDICTED: 1-aminocyclopropane-1-carboxylate oxidase 3 [Prunus mume]